MQLVWFLTWMPGSEQGIVTGLAIAVAAAARLAPGPAREAEVADRGPRAGADRERPAVNAGGQPEATGERSRPRSISVVIPAYNAAATLAEQLEALAGQEYEGDWELVIVDNGSTDGTADLARRYRPRFKALTLVDGGPQRGHSAPRNAGRKPPEANCWLVLRRRRRRRTRMASGDGGRGSPLRSHRRVARRAGGGVADDWSDRHNRAVG